MTFKARDLGAPLGRSIPNEGRVVIYKPKPTKGKQMAFGKAKTSYDLSISPTTVEDVLKRSLESHYKLVSNLDSYGRTNENETLYKYPSLADDAIKAKNVPPFEGEIKGYSNNFYRFGENHNWVPSARVTELTQADIIYQISKVASDVVTKWFNQPGVNKAEVLADIPGTAKDLVPMVASAITGNPWFKSWGLTVG